MIYPVTGAGGGTKYIILGTFNTIYAPKLPSRHRTPYGTGAAVYVNVTELHGDFELVIRWRNLATDEVLQESPKATGTCDDPLKNLELALAFPPLVLQGAGMYAVELYVDELFLGSVRVKVAPRQQGQDDAD